MNTHRNSRTPDFYSVAEICSLGGFSRSTFYSLKSKGLLRVTRILGKPVVAAAEWARFLEVVERGEAA